MSDQPYIFRTVPSESDRTTYCGGPGAATILGVNPYQTPLAFWQIVTHRAPPVEVNNAMRSGMRLERAVLDYAAEELQTEVMPGPFLRHPTLPLGGHLDGITATGQVVEAKTARGKNGWGEPGTSEIPPGYVAQAMHYMGLADAAICWVPVLFSGLDFALYRIDRDDATISAMRDICAEWWRVHVEGDTPPPPVNGADAARLFPRDTGIAVVADDAVAEAVERLRAIKAQTSELEEAREALEDRIKLAMGPAATLLVNGEPAVTWRHTKPSKRFSSALLKAKRPELYDEFCEEITSRRFLVK